MKNEQERRRIPSKDVINRNSRTEKRGARRTRHGNRGFGSTPVRPAALARASGAMSSSTKLQTLVRSLRKSDRHPSMTQVLWRQPQVLTSDLKRVLQSLSASDPRNIAHIPFKLQTSLLFFIIINSRRCFSLQVLAP